MFFQFIVTFYEAVKLLDLKEKRKNWQSGLFLYGAPATSKTLWADLAKRLIPKSRIQEFSRTQNQFTAGQLEHCSLLIVSDLVELSSKQFEVIQRILGRDILDSSRIPSC